MFLRTLRTYVAVSIWVCAVYMNAIFLGLLLYRLLAYGPSDPFLWLFALLIAFLAFVPLDWTDGTLARRFTRFAAAEGAAYFPIHVTLDDPDAFRKGQGYVMGLEPHSSLPLALPAVFSTRASLLPLPLRGNIHGLASSVCFNIPLVRQLWWWLGLRPVTRHWMEKLLRKAKSVVLVPGGVQEVLLLQRNKEVLFLRSRRGFVKLAIRNGAPVVPVFAFGQTRTYSWIRPGPPFVPAWLVDRVSRLIGAVPIFMYGVYGTPLPNRTPMHVVIGKPIELGRTESPSHEQVEEGLRQYIEALKDLYERYKGKCGQADVELVVL